MSLSELAAHPEVRRFLLERARAGGHRSGKLRLTYQTPARRSEIARIAGLARWRKPQPDRPLSYTPLVDEDMANSPFAWMLGIRGGLRPGTRTDDNGATAKLRRQFSSP